MNIKKWPIALLSILFAFSINAKTLLISDVDDTIKETNTLSKIGMYKGAILGFQSFDFIGEIYKQTLEHVSSVDDVEMIYLSYSPKLLVNQAKWNRQHGFPAGRVFLRKLFKEDKVLTYKIKKIEALLKEDPSITHLICFGDNSDKDEYVYDTIRTNYPNLHVEIYIRDIRVQAFDLDNRLPVKKLDGITYFLSEKDLLEDFSFLSSDLREKIRTAKRSKLVPDFIINNFHKKIEKSLDMKDKDAKRLATSLIVNHLNN